MKPTQIHLVVIDDDLDVQDMVTAFFKTKDFKITRFICTPVRELYDCTHADECGHQWAVSR